MSKIYHVEFKDRQPKDYYFGSKAGIFDKFTKEEIGLSLYELWETKLDEPQSCKETNKCFIRFARLHRKKTNRGKKQLNL